MSERADFKTRFSSENQPVKTGRKRGSRDKLSSDFLTALSSDFALHGVQVIESVRAERPADYLKIVASLQPKEIEVTSPESRMSDEQLEQFYALLLSGVKVPQPEEETGATH